LLPMIHYVIKNGDTTFYQWVSGTAPKNIETNLLDRDQAEIESDNQQIDFGAIDQSGIVDFGDAPIIDFDADLVDEGIAVEASGLEMSVSEEPQLISRDGVARGDDALSIFEHKRTQHRIMDDLLELDAFLCVRLRESSNTQPAAMLMSNALTSRALDRPPDTLAEMRQRVQHIIRQLNDPKFKHLYKIRAAPKYLNRLVEQLSAKQTQSGRHERLADVMRQKQTESAAAAVQLRERLQNLIVRTKELQKQIEEDISAKYNRKVNIMGEIKTILSSA